MATVSRALEITQGNLDNHHIYLSEVMDIFPDDTLGGPDESQAAPRTVRVTWGYEFVDTDIVRDKHIFRKRAWVRQFFANNRAAAGDRVLLVQEDPYVYRVQHVRYSNGAIVLDTGGESDEEQTGTAT